MAGAPQGAAPPPQEGADARLVSPAGHRTGAPSPHRAYGNAGPGLAEAAAYPDQGPAASTSEAAGILAGSQARMLRDAAGLDSARRGGGTIDAPRRREAAQAFSMFPFAVD